MNQDHIIESQLNHLEAVLTEAVLTWPIAQPLTEHYWCARLNPLVAMATNPAHSPPGRLYGRLNAAKPESWRRELSMTGVKKFVFCQIDCYSWNCLVTPAGGQLWH